MAACWRKVDGILYPSSTVISYHLKDRHILYYFRISLVTDDTTRSSAIVLNYFHNMYQSHSCIKRLYFIFPQTSSFINSIYLSFSLFEPWIFCCFPSWVPLCFGVSLFLFFRMLWMLVTVSKSKFSRWETLITFSKCLATRYAVHKIEFTFVTFTSLLVCPLTSAIIIFFETHDMSCFHTRSFKLE